MYIYGVFNLYMRDKYWFHSRNIVDNHYLQKDGQRTSKNPPYIPPSEVFRGLKPNFISKNSLLIYYNFTLRFLDFFFKYFKNINILITILFCSLILLFSPKNVKDIQHVLKKTFFIKTIILYCHH